MAESERQRIAASRQAQGRRLMVEKLARSSMLHAELVQHDYIIRWVIWALEG